MNVSYSIKLSPLEKKKTIKSFGLNKLQYSGSMCNLPYIFQVSYNSVTMLS